MMLAGPMSRAATRNLRIAEPVAIFLLIESYIWVFRGSHRWLWLPILGCIVFSHLARRERPKALGFQSANLGDCLSTFAPMLIFLGLAGMACGLLLQTTRPIDFAQGMLAFAVYIPWGIFQQYLLNGYFLTRFEAVLSARAAPLVSAALFSGAHTPNWLLMAVTLLGGYAATQLYRRYRNLYFLGLAHALFGFVLYLVVPDSISHHLNVGPGH
jgi:membrane protease YdiL (CAAX protease family)